MSKNKTIAIIEAAIILVIGVLFCFERSMGISLISTILGVSTVVGGVVFLGLGFFGKKSFLKIDSFIGAFLISLGILFFDVNIFSTILHFLNILLITFGGLILADGLLGRFYRHENSQVKFVFKLILGVIVVTVGILLLTVESFRDFSSIVFGACLIAFSLYFLVMTLSDKTPEDKKDEPKEIVSDQE